MEWLRDTLGRLRGGAPAPESGDAALHLNRGSALLDEGRFEDAANSLEKALAAALAKPVEGVAPHQVHYLLGRAYAGLGRPAPASMSFEAAVRARPDFPEALEEGAKVLQDLEEHDAAVDWLQRLVQLRPTAATRLQLARALRSSGRNEEAADLLRQLCAKEPRNIDAALLHHHVLVSLGRFQQALAEIDRVLKMCKPDAALLVNRAVPLERLGRHDDALACIAKALKLDPTHPRALADQASVLLGQLRVQEAIAAAEAGLRLHPDDPQLHWTLSAGLLLLGDLPRGFAESEWRTRAPGYEGTVPDFGQPRWQGESLAGRTIFLYAEQGMGDAIQFLRFVPEVARMAGTVLLLVWPELEPLVAPTLPANCRIVPRGAALPAHDFHCPLMSVPGVLQITLDKLPAQVPYLQAPPAALQAWRQRLDAQQLNVGICWAGNPRHLRDPQRSMSLATMRVIDVKGCRFLTLQPQKRAGDDEALAAWGNVVDTGQELADFAQTAALIEALDLVITVDTAVAHLAGALGKPVWILLHHGPEWRWMLKRADSPWYPSARLYRQEKPGRWAPVLARVKEDLTALARARPSPSALA
jgi:tetratricopeptide (TPR) repeat protein